MSARRFLTLLPCLMALVACRKAQIVTYQVPHEEVPDMSLPSTSADMASTSVPTGTSGALTWSAPAHWEERAAGSMRQATYAIVGANGSEADLSVTSFPGDVGGLLANINRWRGQIGLSTLTEAELDGASEHLDVNDLHITFVDYTSGATVPGQRLLGAVVPLASETWFFKLTGPAELVGPERPAFLAFLNTLHTP